MPDQRVVRLVVLEDSEIDAELLVSALRRGGFAFEALRATNRAEFEAAISHGQVDAILADYSLPDFDGRQALAISQERCPEVPFIFVSGVLGEEFAVESLKQGATDYVLKQSLPRLPAAVRRAITDARQRREASEALAASEVSMRLALDAAGLGLWDYRPATGELIWDARCKALFGLPPDAEVTYRTFLRGVHPEDRERMEAVVRDATTAGSSDKVTDEYRTVALDGTERWVTTYGRSFFADGVCTRFIGVVQDVTERRRVEEALRRLNETLEARVYERTRERDRVWHVSRDLLTVADLNGHFESVNPAWTATLGWSSEELRRMSVLDLVHPDDRAATEELLTRLGDGRSADRIENRLRHRDDSYRWFSWTAAPDQGLIYAVGRDVTSEKSAAEELEAANRQLRAQIEERERVEATLRQMQRLEAVGQLTAGVAHDFNNLLTVVLGNLGFVEKGVTAAGMPGRLLQRLGHMRTAAERGAKLTGQLLAFSRRQRLEPKSTDLNELVGGMRELLRSTLGGTIQLEAELDEELWPALVDETQIELVVLNLAINARDAMPDGGTLRVSTRNMPAAEAGTLPFDLEAGDYVVLAVGDTGTGMTEQVLAKAFEPFFTTKEVGKGSGLGLAQVYGFAKQSGGGVRIDTEVGKGTTVSVLLPRARRIPLADSMPAAEAEASGPDRTVLVVDDDAAVRDVTAAVLRDLGYKTLEAGNGEAGLAILGARPTIDLVVVDYAMPGMNGAEMVRIAREMRPELPVLFVTGYADLGALSGIGEERIVQKPFRDGELGEKVRRALDGVTPTA